MPLLNDQHLFERLPYIYRQWKEDVVINTFQRWVQMLTHVITVGSEIVLVTDGAVHDHQQKYDGSRTR